MNLIIQEEEGEGRKGGDAIVVEDNVGERVSIDA